MIGDVKVFARYLEKRDYQSIMEFHTIMETIRGIKAREAPD